MAYLGGVCVGYDIRPGSKVPADDRTGLVSIVQVMSTLVVEIGQTRQSRVLDLIGPRLVGLGQPSDRMCIPYLLTDFGNKSLPQLHGP